MLRIRVLQACYKTVSSRNLFHKAAAAASTDKPFGDGLIDTAIRLNSRSGFETVSINSDSDYSSVCAKLAGEDLYSCKGNTIDIVKRTSTQSIHPLPDAKFVDIVDPDGMHFIAADNKALSVEGGRLASTCCIGINGSPIGKLVTYKGPALNACLFGTSVRHVPAARNVQQRRPFSSVSIFHDDREYNEFRFANFRNEGVDVVGDPLCIADRSELLREIYGKLRASKVVLLKGPPRTGKTSTARILKHDALNSGKYKEVHSVWGTRAHPGLIQQLQRQNPAVTYIHDLAHTDHPTLLIIDEAHLTYGESVELGHAELWGEIKQLRSNRKGKLDILLLAPYGVGRRTPCEFVELNTVYPQAIAFTRSELQSMARKWNSIEHSSLGGDGASSQPVKMAEILPLTEGVVDALHDLTAGHAGLSRLAVETLGEIFLDPRRNRNEEFPVAEGALVAALHSKFLTEKLLASRAMPGGDWQPEDESIVRRILTEQSVRSYYSFGATELHASVTRLVKSGLVAEDRAGRVRFTSPLLAMAALRKLCFNSCTPAQRPEVMPPVRDLLVSSLCRTRHSVLARCLAGKSNIRHRAAEGNDLENQFHVEWCLAAAPLLPSDCYAMSNLGPCHHPPTQDDPVQDTHGMLDFHVSDNCDNKLLGLEMTRNSDQLSERLARRTGRYAGIYMREYVVVNFVDCDALDCSDAALKEVAAAVLDGEMRVLWSPANAKDFIVATKQHKAAVHQFVNN